MRRFKTGVFLLGVFFDGCFLGCATDKTFTDAMIVVDKAAQLAEKHGLSYEADLTWSGSPEFYYRQAGGLDTGVRLAVRFRGNAAAGRPMEVGPPAPEGMVPP